MADSYRRETGQWPWCAEDHQFWENRLTNPLYVRSADKAISPEQTPRGRTKNRQQSTKDRCGTSNTTR